MLNDLNETQTMIRDTVRDFARQVIQPRARQMDETGHWSPEIVAEMAKLNILGIPFPEEYGGAGADYLSYVIAVEEVAKVCGSTALTLAAHTTLGTSPIFNFGSEEQKRKYVPKLARGEWIGAYGLTESSAGSDASGTKTMAVRQGNDYVLNGSKVFCTNASFATTFVCTAVTAKGQGNKGISAFIVEKTFPGFAVGKKEDKLGMRGSDTCELVFQDARVPVENRIGPEGEGFKYFMKTLDAGRISIGALALGLAEGAMDRSVRYARERIQFDVPIAQHQAIQHMISDMATEIEAARLLVYNAARLKDAGRPFSQEASMAKLFASEMAMRATKNAIQLHGGYGFMSEYEVERFYRDAKLCEIGEGTSEIQRLVIARAILGRT